jgi:hypothetical protein
MDRAVSPQRDEGESQDGWNLEPGAGRKSEALIILHYHAIDASYLMYSIK